MEIREPTPAAADRIREVVDSSLTASFRLSPAQIDGLVDDQFADEAVTDKREDEETLLQVAETSSEIEDTTITGFVEGRLKDGWGEVRWLFVDPEHRGKGIGTELYETATETLRDRGAEHICVTVLEANTEGHDFVERLGLEHDGDRRVEIADESVVNYVYTEPDVDATLPDSTGEDAADGEFPETKRVGGQLTTTDDGTTAYIARDEGESGTAAPFFATYEDDTHTEQHGFYCANCGSLEVSMNNMDRLECNDCGNSHTERSEASYDGSYL